MGALGQDSLSCPYPRRDERAPDRFRLLKLAWEYAGDSFGARQLLFEMYNAGTIPINRARILNTYDTAPLSELAKRLAGVPTK